MTNLVFLGDSVTDCSRKRAARYEGLPESLGHGWVNYVTRQLNARPNVELQVWNRGFSGCQTHELMQQEDWWPNTGEGPVRGQIATIMLGINDVWHPFWKNQPHQIDRSLAAYDNLINQVKQRAETVIVMEPVALPGGDVTQQWWPILDQLSQGQEELAAKNSGCYWLSVQESLLHDAQGRYSDYLNDGVHPSDLGHRWLSKLWLNFIIEHSLLDSL